MKSIILIIATVSLSIGACKIGEHAPVKTTSSSSEQTSPKTSGKVSHQYKATGCATVIIIKNGDELITIIPKDKLSDNFDVDGLEISFDYRPLKMHNPEGCNAGFPAEVTNIKLKK